MARPKKEIDYDLVKKLAEIQCTQEEISSIFMMIFNMWKQHIYYLNIEENRYLAELRDALLPDLMTGKIEL